ncbi:MAG TPA: hypothetical protein VK249_01980 [Anaerolineales bacterium]|nr:hypothetical protein [Anaerolineales bacterium]
MKTRVKLLEFRFTLLVILLVCSIPACAPPLPDQTSQSPTATPEIIIATVSPTPEPTNTPVLACPQTQADILGSGQENTYGFNAGNAQAVSSRTDSLTLITYQVRGDRISDPFIESIPDNLIKDQQDVASQQEAWQLFTTLIPTEDRRMVAQYLAITDGPGKTLAAVQQTQTNPKKWIIELDVADVSDKLKLIFTLLHEYGHLVTLNASQVPPDIPVFKNPHNVRLYDQQVAACQTYYTRQGCSKPDSYINQFYTHFWADIIEEWQQISKPSGPESADEYNRRMSGFYQKYSDRFVDDYGITNPIEDIAESFAFFILSQQPKDDVIKDQKILFFYRYPELVQLRSRILSNLCSIK